MTSEFQKERLNSTACEAPTPWEDPSASFQGFASGTNPWLHLVCMYKDIHMICMYVHSRILGIRVSGSRLLSEPRCFEAYGPEFGLQYKGAKTQSLQNQSTGNQTMQSRFPI